MNLSILPPIHSSSLPAHPGVYADLDELIRLQFKVHGVSFLRDSRCRVCSPAAGHRGSEAGDLTSRNPALHPRGRHPHHGLAGHGSDPEASHPVYTEERDRPVLQVIDQRLGMFFGSQAVMKSVTAAEVAAMAAWRTFSVGDRLGALVFNDREVPGNPSPPQPPKVMQILETVGRDESCSAGGWNVEPNPAMLNRVLERVLHLAKHDYLVAIISDFNGADEGTKTR